MVEVPLEIPLTKPVLLTVATPVLDEIHGVTVVGIPEPLSCEELPLQKVNVPVMIGLPLTVTDVVAVVAHCPIVGVKV